MFDPTKRKTLETLLTALSLALVKPQEVLQAQSLHQLVVPELDLSKINQTTMQGFAKLLEACWQLSRSNELGLAERLLSECMPTLVSLAQHPSLYQQAAAHLAAQGFKLYSIFALHRNDPASEELYGKQAVEYSILAADPSLFIASSKRLGNKYYYQNQYPQALQTYLNTLPSIKQASPLQQASVYMSLAVAYAHLDQKQDALNYLDLALDTFPDHPEADPCFFYTEFDSSQMILWDGIIRTQLGQTKQAFDIFHRIDQPDVVASERVRIEVINQLAKTAIVSGDLKQGAAYVEAGMKGARALGSQRRFNEAYENYKQMTMLWPHEQPVKALGEMFAL